MKITFIIIWLSNFVQVETGFVRTDRWETKREHHDDEKNSAEG